MTDDGAGVTPTDGVSITNHFCAALFSQIEVHLNGSQICNLSAPLSYAFKHHIDFVLSNNKNVLTNVGQSEGFCRKHDGGCHFNFDLVRPDNMTMCQDIEENRQRILNGKKVYFSSTLPVDIFHTDKYLPPNVNLHRITQVQYRLWRDSVFAGRQNVPHAFKGIKTSHEKSSAERACAK